MLRSPARLTALMIGCSLLVPAVGFTFYSLHVADTHPALLALCLAVLVLGYLGMLWTSSTLHNEVVNERWPAETLAPFRRVIDHTLWKLLSVLLLLAMLGSLVVSRPRHQPWFWVVFFLMQAQTQITYAFTRPRTRPSSGPPLNWSEVAPLRSEHWGER